MSAANLFRPECAGASCVWHAKCPRCGASRHDNCRDDAAFNAQLARRNGNAPYPAALIEAPATCAPDLLATLREVRDLIDGYVDIKDGANGPLPNDAMRAQQLIDAAIAAAEGGAG